MRLSHFVLMLAVPAATAAAQQSTAPTPNPASATPASPQSAKTSPTPRKTPALQRIPMETAPPTPPNPTAAAQEAQQRAADDKLRAQQQAQSAKDAQVTNAIVNQAQQRQDKMQEEIRIQDAPGPAQTGIVPAAGPPVIPATTQVAAPSTQQTPTQTMPAAIPPPSS